MCIRDRAITGRVLPVTNQDVRLEAEFHDGSRTLGESKIFYAKKINTSRIRKVRLVPELSLIHIS